MSFPYNSAWLHDVIGQGYQKSRVFRSLVSDLSGPGADQRSPQSGVNILWKFSLTWDGHLSQFDAQGLYYSYVMSGGQRPLLWFEWRARAWSSVYVGLGNGTSNPITLPVKGATPGTVFVTADGFPVNGTLLSGSGTAGQDQWDPVGTVTNGDPVRVSFYGRRRRMVVFEPGDSFALSLTPRSAPLRWMARANIIETSGTDLL